MTENGWKFILAAMAGLLIYDQILSDYHEKKEAARTEQERYDREFAVITENYASE